METYAKRLHNPFAGILHVMVAGRTRALSFNGLDWELQFLCQSSSGSRYARIGRWRSREGFKPYPLAPDIDPQAVEADYGAVVEALASLHLPLPQDDHYELWLLDEVQGCPLALLGSCRHADEMVGATVRSAWKAVTANQLQLANTPEEIRQGLPPVSYRLEQQVKQRAGQNPVSRWFMRQADGTGHRLGSDGSILTTLPAVHFPELLLREDWETPQAQTLCERYLHRLAPRLLALQGLSLATRERVEQQACQYAQEVDASFHLYPAVANPQRMTALRVEARLRAACG